MLTEEKPGKVSPGAAPSPGAPPAVVDMMVEREVDTQAPQLPVGNSQAGSQFPRRRLETLPGACRQHNPRQPPPCRCYRL